MHSKQKPINVNAFTFDRKHADFRSNDPSQHVQTKPTNPRPNSQTKVAHQSLPLTSDAYYFWNIIFVVRVDHYYNWNTLMAKFSIYIFSYVVLGKHFK